MGKDGEMMAWTGQGVGKFTGRGSAVSFRGALYYHLYYQTSSSKWSRLNGIAGVFEYETDEKGNTHAKVWEWK